MSSDYAVKVLKIIEEVSGGDPLAASFINGLLVAATTTLGSLGVLFARRSSLKLELELAFAAGVMLVSSFTSLILPGIEQFGFPAISLGIALGVLLIHLVDRFTPHEHLFKGYEGPPEAAKLLRKTALLALAILIHNIPEGLVVGVATFYSIPLGVVTAVAIGTQDIPEGFAVALPVSKLRGKAAGVAVGALSGLSETIAAVLAAALLQYTPHLLPLAMGLAGGAMLYVTLKELIPEIYREDASELKVTLGFLLGFYLMLLLDTMLTG